MVAAGSGITLTRSSNVLLAEIDYSPANINQAVDRVHRIGAKSQVVVHYFMVKGSIDQAIEEILISKTKDFNRILDAS
jgi:SWI/SNF-related matrix-associated actin-dependent regulator 1 of chromatin subfamily A